MPSPRLKALPEKPQLGGLLDLLTRNRPDASPSFSAIQQPPLRLYVHKLCTIRATKARSARRIRTLGIKHAVAINHPTIHRGACATNMELLGSSRRERDSIVSMASTTMDCCSAKRAQHFATSWFDRALSGSNADRLACSCDTRLLSASCCEDSRRITPPCACRAGCGSGIRHPVQVFAQFRSCGFSRWRVRRARGLHSRTTNC